MTVSIKSSGTSTFKFSVSKIVINSNILLGEITLNFELDTGSGSGPSGSSGTGPSGTGPSGTRISRDNTVEDDVINHVGS